VRFVHLAGWGMVRAYRCSRCGEDWYIGPTFASPGYGPVDEDALAQAVVGDPPLCAECRADP
jgi:hypothetical protein